jgi:hypothetical protein
MNMPDNSDSMTLQYDSSFDQPLTRWEDVKEVINFQGAYEDSLIEPWMLDEED